MYEKYIMAIDQGTTSSRAIIVNQVGQIIASDQAEFKQYYPQAGWVEHDPQEIWNNVQKVMSGALINGQLDPQQIHAIGITNQRETSLIWDQKTGQPIYNAIVWQSRQTSAISDDLLDKGYGSFIQERTGLIPDAYFSATKIRWILDHVPGAQARAEAGDLLFGTIDTWLLWKLSNGQVHMTDYTNASRTMLLNLKTLDWDDEILHLLNIPKKILPQLKSNSEIYAHAQSYHFHDHQVPIAAMIGDQQAALFGQLAFEKGMVKSTYGTGAFIIMNTGQEIRLSDHQLLSTVAYVLGDQVTYALEGSIFVAGSAIQWLRDGLNLFSKASESEALAMDASDQETPIYMVPAFTGLGAPYWNPDVRGMILGLSRGTNKADLAKATLQAIAYQVKDVVDTMEADAKMEINQVRVDGGAASNHYLLQFQADILGKELVQAQEVETTALGAAYLAGLATNYWQSLDQLKALLGQGQVFQPHMDQIQGQKLYQGWQKAVKAAAYYADLCRED
ncbi:glycerol kinase GlpK [Eremococcus coleocola]|uniref:Glycerol kinase n=1 Tax=Eremococcus coleocola ACS-139-V-Col8 TaxID=908337 RepID=E4KQ38_9LACT|nr:glycerol kinase [Eremococcus coleocola ACS-139-V-Col8]